MRINSRLNFNSLQLRIFWSFFALLLVLQLISSYLFYQAARDNVQTRAQSNLESGQAIFNNELASRNRYLTTSVNTVAKDWAFRSAVGKMDVPTLQSTLTNHRLRIGADISLIADIEGRSIASSGLETIELAEDIQQILRQKNQPAFSRVLMIEGKPYQVVFSAIHAPAMIGWVGMGFSIDDALAEHFHVLTSVHVSFVLMEDNQPRVLATTLIDAKPTLPVLQQGTLSPSEMVSLAMTKHVWLTSYLSLPDTGDVDIRVLMQKSLDELLNQFRSWWTDLLLLNILGLLLTLGVAYLTARTVSGPIRKLVGAVANVGAGQYDQTIEVVGRDEIGKLAAEFNRMTQAVSIREQEIRYRAEYDTLTGLMNRERFLDVVAETFASYQNDRRMALVMVVDINRLKEVNDTLGHHNGDLLIQKISHRLQEHLSDDYQLARLGSELALLTTVAQYDDIHDCCRTIHDLLDEPVALNNIELRASVRIGAAIYPNHADDALTLLRFADIALNMARGKSLPVVVYDSHTDQHSILRLSLMSDLRQAIRDNQLVLYYQPKLDLRNGVQQAEVNQVECLVRWIHPIHGFIPPDDFIPLAEQTGSITALTEWVLDHAVQQAAGWREQGYDLTVAVNISAVDLLQGRLVEQVPECLQQYRVPADRLTLEITESAVAEDPRQAIATLSQIRNLGVTLSIDDYGTGYSSMAQLKKLPVHELKIDKSFVLQVTEDEDDAVIVRSTVELGHNMGLKVTAEGVESQQALELLEEYDCDQAQGFYMSKPLAVTEFNEWLEQTHYRVARRDQTLRVVSPKI